jgi:hypothetical protein
MKRSVFRKGVVFLAIFFIIALADGLSAMGQNDPETSAGVQSTEDYPKGKITISGRVRLVGSAAFSRLVITDEKNRDWYVEGADREKLSSMEQRTVKVKGTTEYQDIVLANGENVGVRRFLRKITIVN